MFASCCPTANLLELVLQFDTLLSLLLQADFQTLQPVVLLQSRGGQRRGLLLQIQHRRLEEKRESINKTETDYMDIQQCTLNEPMNGQQLYSPLPRCTVQQLLLIFISLYLLFDLFCRGLAAAPAPETSTLCNRLCQEPALPAVGQSWAGLWINPTWIMFVYYNVY